VFGELPVKLGNLKHCDPCGRMIHLFGPFHDKPGLLFPVFYTLDRHAVGSLAVLSRCFGIIKLRTTCIHRQRQRTSCIAARTAVWSGFRARPNAAIDFHTGTIGFDVTAFNIAGMDVPEMAELHP
jgi:hypothetical protein